MPNVPIENLSNFLGIPVSTLAVEIFNSLSNIYGEYKYNFNTNKHTPILGTEAIYKGISTFYEYDIVNKHNIMGIGYKLSLLKYWIKHNYFYIK